MALGFLAESKSSIHINRSPEHATRLKVNGRNLLGLKVISHRYLKSFSSAFIPSNSLPVATHLSISVNLFIYAIWMMNGSPDSDSVSVESWAATVRGKRGSQITCAASQPEAKERKPVEFGGSGLGWGINEIGSAIHSKGPAVLVQVVCLKRRWFKSRYVLCLSLSWLHAWASPACLGRLTEALFETRDSPRFLWNVDKILLELLRPNRRWQVLSMLIDSIKVNFINILQYGWYWNILLKIGTGTQL